MSVEIEFPLEFIVRGTPVSLQAKRAQSKIEWKDSVKRASYIALPEGHFWSDVSISVTLFYFPNTTMEGDVDNIVKPVLDALCKHIYRDDKQVDRVWVQKFEPGRVFKFTNPSEVLAEALDGEKPLLFVRLGDDPAEGLV
jgi:Holliday junction resolvase RusA-like endonuclease